MSTRITLHNDKKSIYDICIESSFDNLPRELGQLDISRRRLCIVSDSAVASLYLNELEALLTPCAREVISFVFPAGEESKTLDTVRELYEHLILHQFDRKDLLIALGGGVTGDLAGFAAATYLRGIEFVQVPTTLLAQVDSSIGGKTGVDFSSYKNMVGAFHNPSLVYINLSVLSTLSERQYLSGLGEIVKYGLINDPSYYDWISCHIEEIRRRDPGTCEEMISGSCHIKQGIVEEDWKEQGERALLNFGHTLGHAIEKEMKFALLHGECVAIGSMAAAWLSCRRNLISEEDVHALRALFDSLGVPRSLKADEIDPKAVLNAVKHDKKMDAGSIRFILLGRIGQAYIETSVTEKELEDALSAVLD